MKLEINLPEDVASILSIRAAIDNFRLKEGIEDLLTKTARALDSGEKLIIIDMQSKTRNHYEKSPRATDISDGHQNGQEPSSSRQDQSSILT